MNKLDRLSNVTNDAEPIVAIERPYGVTVTIQGSAPQLCHRWSNDAVEAKGKAAKNSKAKKTDDVESYVYRNDKGYICLPSEAFRQSIIGAAKYRQDPRSPRKSAQDLYKAGLVAPIELASLGSKQWDYLDRRRAVVQRAAITRVRPAFLAGWKVTFELLVMLPEYIDPESLRSLIEYSGRIIGIGDFRPTFGRFGITKFEVRAEA